MTRVLQLTLRLCPLVFSLLQQILQLGGELFITGCTFLNLSPFNIRVAIFLGNDVSVFGFRGMLCARAQWNWSFHTDRDKGSYR